MARWTKPTLDTKFHIDFDWWKQNDRQLRVYLHQNLCDACRELYPTHRGSKAVDWIDPDTAEVHPVDGLWQALRTHCSLEPDYIAISTPLTNAVFRVFLANGNVPLTPAELSERVGRPAELILKSLARRRVYDGIKAISSPS
jgi:hypothetical protein